MKHHSTHPSCSALIRFGLLPLLASLMLLLFNPSRLSGQSEPFTGTASNSFSASSSAPVAPNSSSELSSGSTRGFVAAPATRGSVAFSRVAFGADVSPLGVGLMAATNLTRHLNLRAAGSLFNYTTSDFNTQGFNVTAKLNLASARAAVDYYPFHSGFRLSPGVLFYNQNKGNLNLAVNPGQSFTLNNQTYYSATGANAVKGLGTFGLGNGSPAFTATTGWGNAIPRSGRHFSFPVEIGVAFIKQPTLNFNLTGLGCDQTGVYCVDVATNPQIQQNIAIQVKKYQDDIEPLKTYPIASFGVAYNFSTRRSSMYR